MEGEKFKGLEINEGEEKKSFFTIYESQLNGKPKVIKENVSIEDAHWLAREKDRRFVLDPYEEKREDFGYNNGPDRYDREWGYQELPDPKKIS